MIISISRVAHADMVIPPSPYSGDPRNDAQLLILVVFTLLATSAGIALLRRFKKHV